MLYAIKQKLLSELRDLAYYMQLSNNYSRNRVIDSMLYAIKHSSNWVIDSMLYAIKQ